MPPNQPTVVILCGGRGTRIQEHSAEVPKPLIEIGGRPIVWHVISMYLPTGFAASCCSPVTGPSRCRTSSPPSPGRGTLG